MTAPAAVPASDLDAELDAALRNDDAAPDYLAHRHTAAGESAADELDRTLLAPKPEQQNQGSAPASGQPEPGVDPLADATPGDASTIKSVVGDVARGVTEVPRAVVQGVRKGLQESLDFVGEIGDAFIGEKPTTGAAATLTLPKLPFGEPKTATGRLVEGTAQFIAGFAGAGKMLKEVSAATKVGKGAKALAQGAIGNMAAFDPHEQRLSNLVQRFPVLSNPVTNFLEAKPDDTAAEGRFKNAVEGFGLGAVTDGLLAALKAVRAVRAAKAVAKTTGEYQPKVTPEDLSILGDPANPDLIATTKPAPAPEPNPADAKIAAGVSTVKGRKPINVISPPEQPPQTYINFANINAPEDVQKVMQRMADTDKSAVDKAKRGVQTFAQTKLRADQQDAWKLLMGRRKGEPLNAEQSLAARQLWVASSNKLTEVAQVAAASPSTANLFAFRKMMAVHFAVQREVLAARTETARALNAWKIPAGGPLMLGKQLDTMLGGPGGEEAAKSLAQKVAVLAENGKAAQFEKLVEGGVWAKTKDAVAQVWINGLLSNPQTHIVNTVSNLAVAAQQVYERKVGSFISQVLGTQDGIDTGEALAMLNGQLQGFKEALRMGVKTRGKSFLPENAAEALGSANKIEVQQGALSADAFNISHGTPFGRALDLVDVVTRAPGRLLQAGDEWFKSIGYRGELHAQATRMAAEEVNSGVLSADKLKSRIAEIIADPPDNIKLQAVDAALYDTFQSKPAATLDRIGTAIQKVPILGRLLLPFKNTPINIMTYVAERSPFAPLVRTWRADIQAGGARSDLAMARTATGSMMMAAAMDMALSGTITGSAPSEPGARALFYREGKQPYSVKAGDKWYAYGRLDPVGMTIGVAADTADIIANAGSDLDKSIEHASVGVALSIAKNVTSKTYMSGIAQFFDAVSDPDRYGDNYFQHLTSSFIPAGMGVAAREADPYMRIASDATDALKKKIPYWSKDLPPYRDLWGRLVDYRSGKGALYDILSPIYVKKENPEPIDTELERLGYFPEMPGHKIQYKGVTLDLSKHPAAYARYVQLAGNDYKDPAWQMGAKDLLNAIVEGKHPLSQVYRLYSDGPDGGKAAFIRQTIDRFRQGAKDELLKESPALQVEYEFNKKPFGGKLDPAILGLGH